MAEMTRARARRARRIARSVVAYREVGFHPFGHRLPARYRNDGPWLARHLFEPRDRILARWVAERAARHIDEEWALMNRSSR